MLVLQSSEECEAVRVAQQLRVPHTDNPAISSLALVRFGCAQWRELDLERRIERINQPLGCGLEPLHPRSGQWPPPVGRAGDESIELDHGCCWTLPLPPAILLVLKPP